MALGGSVLLYYFLRKSLRKDYAALIAVNMVSFVPYGLHSPYYNNLPLLFLTIAYFSFFHVAINQRHSSQANISSFLTGIFLAFTATIYPPLGLCGLFILVLYFIYRLHGWRWYLLGLILGGMWLICVILNIGIERVINAMRFLTEYRDHDTGLLYTLYYYKSILATKAYFFAVLLFLWIIQKYIKPHYRLLWEIVLSVFLIATISIIFFKKNTAYGAGMDYTICLFLLTPILYLFIHRERKAQLLFLCIWIPSCLTWPIIACASGSKGYASLIGQFPGALTALAMLTLVFETTMTNIKLKKCIIIMPLSLLLLIDLGYQYANLNYFYDEMPRAQLTRVFDRGAFKNIWTTPEAYSLITNLEKTLQPLSNQHKTITYLTLNVVGYFVGNFIPYVDVSYNKFTEKRTLQYYIDNKRLPDIAVNIKNYPGYWKPPQSSENRLFLNKYYTLYADELDYSIYTRKS